MSLRCIKILLPLFFITQSIAQLANLGNSGFQNWPAQNFAQNLKSQPFGSNFPAVSNIPFTNPLPNGNAPTNGLQTIPKLSFINGQIGELLNIASNINNRQINSPIVENPINENKLPITNNGLLTNNLAPVNSIYSNGNNLLSVPNNNLPVYNTALNSNQFAYNLPDASSTNLPRNNRKIYSLTLSGQPINNGLPFNVMPAVTSNSVNNIPFNNFINNNDVPNNGVKLPRSLPSNEPTEYGFPASYNMIDNNGIASWQSYNNERQANMMSNNIAMNNIPSDGVPVNNGSPVFNQLPSYGAAVFSSNEVNAIPLNNGNIAMNNMNNVQPRNEQFFANNYQIPSNTEQLVPNTYQIPLNTEQLVANNYQIPSNTEQLVANNYQIPLNTEQLVANNYQIPSNTEQLVANNYQVPTNTEWQQPINFIQGYHNNEMSIANQPASNLGLSQPTGSNLNLPDFTNINMLSLGEFGNFPIFSGLPVIGITETVSVINPEQFNQNPVVSY